MTAGLPCLAPAPTAPRLLQALVGQPRLHRYRPGDPPSYQPAATGLAPATMPRRLCALSLYRAGPASVTLPARSHGGASERRQPGPQLATTATATPVSASSRNPIQHHGSAQHGA